MYQPGLVIQNSLYPYHWSRNMEEHESEASPYTLRKELPSAEEFTALRDANDMTSRPYEAVEQGLPNALFGVIITYEPSSETVAMGRVIGDDGMVSQISDMVVHPDHQRRGLGALMMDTLLSYIEETDPAKAEVNLFADIDGFYERFAFRETRPTSKGMVQSVE